MYVFKIINTYVWRVPHVSFLTPPPPPYLSTFSLQSSCYLAICESHAAMELVEAWWNRPPSQSVLHTTLAGASPKPSPRTPSTLAQWSRVRVDVMNSLSRNYNLARISSLHENIEPSSVHARPCVHELILSIRSTWKVLYPWRSVSPWQIWTIGND
jgi:hypothetical protein